MILIVIMGSKVHQFFLNKNCLSGFEEIFRFVWISFLDRRDIKCRLVFVFKVGTIKMERNDNAFYFYLYFAGGGQP